MSKRVREPAYPQPSRHAATEASIGARWFVCMMGLVLLWTAVLSESSASARDDVPNEIAARSNPVVLEATELRYYERQFKGKCKRCHGRDGKGGSDPAPEPPFVPPADFTNARYMATRTDGQLFYQILKGGGDRCAMPAFGPVSDYAWNEEKIWHMVAYVRRFAASTPP